MATSTPNLALVKPALTEEADIAVINANMDKIDAFAGGVPNIAAGITRRETATSVASGTAFSTAGMTSGLSTLRNDVTFSSNGLVVPVSGLYQVNAGNSWAANGSGRRALAIAVNGAHLEAFPADLRLGFDGNTNSLSIAGLVYLTAGQRVNLLRWQNSGAALNETAAYLSVHLVERD